MKTPFLLTLLLVVGLAGLSQATPPPAAKAAFNAPSNLRAVVLGPSSIRFQWDRGEENFWFCVDTAFTLEDLLGYRGSWANWGCGNPNTIFDVTVMRCGTPHYARVYAAGPNTGAHGNPIFFSTGDCNFTPPTNLRAAPLAQTAARFQWDRGNDNQWYCLDTAQSLDDLTGLKGTWRNWNCLSTTTTADAFDLQCGVRYYWRVYARGTVSGGPSTESTYDAPSCGFTPPSNLRSEALSGTSIRFQWNRGSDNQWFCVDTAKTSEDLNFFKDSFRNHGCGGTATTLDVAELLCGTTYYWRVYARGTELGGHSAEAQAKTADC